MSASISDASAAPSRSPAADERFARLGELVDALQLSHVADSAVLQQQAGPFGVPHLGEREGLAEIVLRLRECVQRQRVLAGIAQRSPRAHDEVVDILARRACELERAGVVVRNHLRVILGTTERLDPLGGTRVFLRPLGARNLPVRDVAHQDVLERELRLTGDRAAPRALHELLLLQRVQALLADTERPEPEHLAQHRGVLQRRLLLRRQPVQARGDDPLHGLRQVDGGPALGQHAHVLLCVERITAGAVEELGLRAGLEQRPVAQRRNQLRRLVGRQRRQRDVRGVELSAGPRRTSLQQLQPRGAEDQHRDISHPVGEMLDEVEQARRRPTADPRRRGRAGDLRRALRRSGATLRTPRPVTPVASPACPTSGRRCASTQSASSSTSCSTARASFAATSSSLSVSRMPACAFTISAERPVADSLAVRQRTSLPPVRQLAAALDRLEQLADEPALADARDADQRYELRRALLSCPRERADEQVDLALASDELRPRLRREVDAEACACLHHLPDGNGLLLAFRLDRVVLAELDRLRRRAIRRLADEDPVHGRRGLEPRRGVDDVARRHALAGLGPRSRD